MAYDPVLAEIGSRIVKRREELHMSATELSILADIPASPLSLYESGRRAMSASKLVAIAEALKVPLSYLQPESLDVFSGCQPDIWRIIEKLNSLPPDKRHLLVNMFEAQIESLQ